MDPTPTPRPRHALRWVLGVGLVFVVVVGMALQVARRRADERWESVLSHWDESLQHDARWGRALEWLTWGSSLANRGEETQTCGGNAFKPWNQSRWECPWFILVLRQERRFFGSKVEAMLYAGVGRTPGGGRITGARGLGERPPALVEAMRTLFAAVDVELVVEP